MTITFLVFTKEKSTVESFFLLASELAKKSAVFFFSLGFSEGMKDGVWIFDARRFSSASRAISMRTDILHVVDASAFSLFFLRLFHPHTRIIYSYSGACPLLSSVMLRLADEVIVHRESDRKPVLGAIGKVPCYLPLGLPLKRFALDSRVLSSFGLLPYQYFLLFATETDDTQTDAIIHAWQAFPFDVKRGHKLAIFGKERTSFSHDIVYLKNQKRDVRDNVLAGSLAGVMPKSGKEKTALELLFSGRPLIFEKGLRIDRRLALCQISANSAEEMLASAMNFINDPLEAASYGHIGRTLCEDLFTISVLAHDVEMMYTQSLAMSEGYLATRES